MQLVSTIRSRRMRVLLQLCGVGLVAFACDSFPEELPAGFGRDDAGTTECAAGACWWSTTTAEGCTSHRLPTPDDRPSNTSDAEVDPIYVAVDKLWLGESSPVAEPGTPNQWASYGFDIDGICTNPLDCLSAPDGELGCRSGTGIPFDGNGCRDNKFGELEPIAAGEPNIRPFGLGEERFNCELHRGGFTIMAKISGYNGEPDDSQLRVDLYMSLGRENLPDWKCEDGVDWEPNAKWLASDKWIIDSTTLESMTSTDGELPPSQVADRNAYAREGYIVAQLPDGSVMDFLGDNANTTGFAMPVQKGLFVAKAIQGPDGLWTAEDGLLAGRVLKDEMRDAFREIGFCEDNVGESTYSILTNYLNANMDVLASGENDPDADCDAMSVAIAFTGRQASPGRIETAVPRIDCPPPPGSGGAAGMAGGGGTAGGSGSGGAAGGSSGGMAGAAGN